MQAGNVVFLVADDRIVTRFGPLPQTQQYNYNTSHERYLQLRAMDGPGSDPLGGRRSGAEAGLLVDAGQVLAGHAQGLRPRRRRHAPGSPQQRGGGRPGARLLLRLGSKAASSPLQGPASQGNDSERTPRVWGRAKHMSRATCESCSTDVAQIVTMRDERGGAVSPTWSRCLHQSRQLPTCPWLQAESQHLLQTSAARATLR